MRQRITYLLPSGTSIDPADIKHDASSLDYSRSAEAAEERRITIGLSEIPEEVSFHTNPHGPNE